MANQNTLELASETAQYLQDLLPLQLRGPAIAVICGSGLGGLADAVEIAPRLEMHYRDIPHFPQSSGMTLGVCRNQDDGQWGSN